MIELYLETMAQIKVLPLRIKMWGLLFAAKHGLVDPRKVVRIVLAETEKNLKDCGQAVGKRH